MKKSMGFILVAVILGIFVSCGPSIPVKEMDAARAALRKAETVDAENFAKNEYKSGYDDFQTATNLILKKKNADAKEKAISSKDYADKAYEIAVKARAEDIYKKDTALLETADKYYASKTFTNDYDVAKKLYDKVDGLMKDKNYLSAYPAGVKAFSNLTKLAADAQKEYDKAKNAIASAQNKYDEAADNIHVKKYAMEDLKKADPILAEARKSFDGGDLADTVTKSVEAEKIIKAALELAKKRYDDAQAAEAARLKAIEETIRLKKAQEKKDSAEYLERARKMLELLKKKDSGTQGFIMPGDMKPMQYIKVPSYSQDALGGDSEEETSGNDGVSPDKKELNESDITYAMVEKYYKLADDAHKEGRYLDSKDYSKEAIRLARILLARDTNRYYVVVENPADRDCLWKISWRQYKKAWLWPVIWHANKYQIKDPDLIYPDQKLKIPDAVVD